MWEKYTLWSLLDLMTLELHMCYELLNSLERCVYA